MIRNLQSEIDNLGKRIDNKENTPITGQPSASINQAYNQLGQFDVPPRFHHAHLGEFSEAVQSQVGDVSEAIGYFITGPTGTGKTHLATAIMKRMIANGRGDLFSKNDNPVRIGTSAMFTKCPEFLGWMMSGFQCGKAEEILREVQKKRILVLDDLGAEKMSEWTFSALYRVISHRYDYYLPTIITSNLTLDTIDQWEPRIASRLAGLTVINLTGADRRMRNK
jgi:DNA replication protein DnaC